MLLSIWMILTYSRIGFLLAILIGGIAAVCFIAGVVNWVNYGKEYVFGKDPPALIYSSFALGAVLSLLLIPPAYFACYHSFESLNVSVSFGSIVKLQNNEKFDIWKLEILVNDEYFGTIKDLSAKSPEFFASEQLVTQDRKKYSYPEITPKKVWLRATTKKGNMYVCYKNFSYVDTDDVYNSAGNVFYYLL